MQTQTDPRPLCTLTISGNGKLWFAGAYPIDDLMGVYESHDEYTHAYAWSCPFEGVTDGAFDKCESMSLDCVRTALVEHVRWTGTCDCRDDVERAFDRDCQRAINACKSQTEGF
jgi:hypothetical protein